MSRRKHPEGYNEAITLFVYLVFGIPILLITIFKWLGKKKPRH